MPTTDVTDLVPIWSEYLAAGPNEAESGFVADGPERVDRGLSAVLPEGSWKLKSL